MVYDFYSTQNAINEGRCDLSFKKQVDPDIKSLIIVYDLVYMDNH